jgi:flavorubredoxin
MAVKITDAVTWVGKVDWDLTAFHGHEYSTHRGTTYNAYLVRGEKTALIDTVYAPYAKEFVRNLEREIDLDQIDFVVANHGEIDHSGALPELMERIPDTPIYCTSRGVRSLTGHFHQNWDFREVQSGDVLSLGDRELHFVAAPMLHWPDSMFCYLPGEEILFSNDAFGQHLATELLFNDLVDQSELYQQCIKYYANILTPFSDKVRAKIQELAGMELPLKMICPSHGVIWRSDPLQIVNLYGEWAQDYQEDRVTILYDTMWEATRQMAEAIGKGVHEASPDTTVVLMNTATRDKNDIITEVFRSRLVLAGSPTINKGILYSMAGILEMIHGMNFQVKRAAAFGSYGWSGEAVKILTRRLQEAGFDIVHGGLKLMWQPDEESRKLCVEFGRTVAEHL